MKKLFNEAFKLAVALIAGLVFFTLIYIQYLKQGPWIALFTAGAWTYAATTYLTLNKKDK